MNTLIEDLYSVFAQQTPYDFEENSKLGFPRGDDNRSQYSDISAHLPLLHFLAHQSKTIVEIGVRDCYSTVAFLLAEKDLWSIDLNSSPTIDILLEEKLPNWTFIQGDSIAVHNHQLLPSSFDLLFIDGLHTADQVKAEINTYAGNVKKFIAFHDSAIHSQGLYSRDEQGKDGILAPIYEFVENHPEWKIVYQCEFNHGLLIIQRFDNE